MISQHTGTAVASGSDPLPPTPSPSRRDSLHAGNQPRWFLCFRRAKSSPRLLLEPAPRSDPPPAAAGDTRPHRGQQRPNSPQPLRNIWLVLLAAHREKKKKRIAVSPCNSCLLHVYNWLISLIPLYLHQVSLNLPSICYSSQPYHCLSPSAIWVFAIFHFFSVPVSCHSPFPL